MYEGVAANRASRLPSVALLRRAVRGKPLGFPLPLSAFRRRQLAEKCENCYTLNSISPYVGKGQTPAAVFSSMPSA